MDNPLGISTDKDRMNCMVYCDNQELAGGPMDWREELSEEKGYEIFYCYPSESTDDIRLFYVKITFNNYPKTQKDHMEEEKETFLNQYPHLRQKK